MFRTPTSNYQNVYYKNNEHSEVDSDFTSQLANFRQEMSSLTQQYPSDGLSMASPGPSYRGSWQPNPRKRPFDAGQKLGYTQQYPNSKNQYNATTSFWESERYPMQSYQLNNPACSEFGAANVQKLSENFDKRGESTQHMAETNLLDYRRSADELGPGYVDFASWQEPEFCYDDRWGTDEKIRATCLAESEKMHQQLLPIPETAKDDVFSPYYGIEQLSDSKDDFDEDIQITDDKYAEQTESIDDEVNCLMRDARIIAGIKPDDDDWKVSETTLKKAREIEVTVPSELMLPVFCKLCNATFDRKMASSHYGGKKHAQKENQYVRKIYEAKGIDVGRFLNKPRTLARKQPKVLVPKTVKKFGFACHLCSMRFENRSNVDSHIASADHRKLVFDRQTEYLSKQILSRSAGQLNNKVSRMAPVAPPNVGTYFCSICEKVTNSRQQYENHILSKKHLAKIAENG
uniref:C2H2-type domain-containing protein n=1 Tax=Romanomermis culicivorax TaxID=13658 RepID=A0A915I1G0_ROMCU